MINYERRGAGEPLVLLHGIGHRWQAWEPVLDRLAAHHDVVAVDLPGFGASPMLAADHPYNMESVVCFLRDMLADMGIERPHLAGNSLGGAIALEAASRGLARSVTALAPAGFWTPADRRWALTVLRAVRSTGRAPVGMRNAFLQHKAMRMLAGSVLFGHPSSVSAEVMLADLDSMVASAGFDAVIEGGGRDYTYRVPAPAVPVTVAWGSRDRILWPRQARRAAELLPAARHVTLPGAGHVPMGDDPERIASLILETCRTSSLEGAA